MNSECVLWLYGLPGTGKGEVAHLLVQKLRAQESVVCLLEESALRAGIGADLGITLEDQMELERRTAQMAAVLAEQGVCTVITFVTAREAQRSRIRRLLASVPYHLVQFELAEEARAARAATASVAAQIAAQSYERSVSDLTLDTGLLKDSCTAILLNLLSASRRNTAAVPQRSVAMQYASAAMPAAMLANPLDQATQNVPAIPLLHLPKAANSLAQTSPTTRPGFKQNWRERERDKLIMKQNALAQESAELLGEDGQPAALDAATKPTVPLNNKPRTKRHVGLDIPWYAHLPMARWTIGGVGIAFFTIFSVGLLAFYAFKQLSPKNSGESRLLSLAAAAIPTSNDSAEETSQTDEGEKRKSTKAEISLEQLVQKTSATQKQKAAETQEQATPSPIAKKDSSNEVVPLTKEQLVQQAQDIAQRFKKAKTWQEKVAFVYEGDHLRPILQNYYEKEQRTDPEISNILEVEEVYQDRHYALKCKGAMQLNSEEACLWLRKDNRGQLKLDWESLVGYSEVAWAELKNKRPTQAVLMRAQCQMGDYYNYEFADRSKYMCWKLTSPDGKHTLYAYSEQALHLKFLASRYSSNKALPITVRVSFPEKAESSECALLREIVEEDWLVAAK
jgi:hypothetical protein